MEGERLVASWFEKAVKEGEKIAFCSDTFPLLLSEVDGFHDAAFGGIWSGKGRTLIAIECIYFRNLRRYDPFGNLSCTLVMGLSLDDRICFANHIAPDPLISHFLFDSEHSRVTAWSQFGHQVEANTDFTTAYAFFCPASIPLAERV